MKRFTHTELTAAALRHDWAALWGSQQSTVKLVVGRMARNGAIRAEDAEDMEQEGMLIAGEAVRTWRPLECALSTHVGNQVRWRLTEVVGRERNHGIGSHQQRAAVLSTEDRFGTPTSAVQSYSGDEDDDEAATFGDALTYDGVLRWTGQFDGNGKAPEGFGDPADEADRLRNTEAIRVAAATLRDTAERNAVTAVLLGESPEGYASRKKVAARTVRNWLSSARKNLSAKLSKSRQ